MKRILSVSLGAAQHDYTVEAQLSGQQVEVSRVGVDGDWDRALELLRANDGQAASIGLEGPWAARDRRVQAARAAVRVSRLADGTRTRPMLARRLAAALEAHLNNTGETLGSMRALLPLACGAPALAVALRSFGCGVLAADLLYTLGLPIPLRHPLAVRLAARALLRVPERSPTRASGPADRWLRLGEGVQLLVAERRERLEVLSAGLQGKIIVLETGSPAQEAELLGCGIRLLALAGPRVGGRTLGPAAVEALLLSLIEKPEPEIETADLEGAVARAPLRPQVLLPR